MAEDVVGLQEDIEDEAVTTEEHMVVVATAHRQTDEGDTVRQTDEVLMALQVGVDIWLGQMEGQVMVHVEGMAVACGAGEHHHHRATQEERSTTGGPLLLGPMEATDQADNPHQGQ